MNYSDVSKKIISYVGGERNIISVTNCVSRLRFTLKEVSLVNEEKIKKLKDVSATAYVWEQYHVVVGQEADKLCNDIKFRLYRFSKRELKKKWSLLSKLSERRSKRHAERAKKFSDVALESDNNAITIKSPLRGNAVSVSEVNDVTFAHEMMGKGVAIIPKVGELVSPVNGTITAIFNSNHAVWLTSDEGVDMLLHIGVDTVQLDGKYMNGHVKTGDRVSIGDLLIDFDIFGIEKAGYDTITSIIVTNHKEYGDVISRIGELVNPGDELIKVIKK